MPTQPPEKVLNLDFPILVIRPLRFLLLDAITTSCVCCRRWLRVRAVCVGRRVMVEHGCFIPRPPQIVEIFHRTLELYVAFFILILL